jgi:hypothetical protein
MVQPLGVAATYDGWLVLVVKTYEHEAVPLLLLAMTMMTPLAVPALPPLGVTWLLQVVWSVGPDEACATGARNAATVVMPPTKAVIRSFRIFG